MSIDITSMKDLDEVLAMLGAGDWEIVLMDDYPDLVVTAAWRQRLHDMVAEQFTYWVLKGVSIDINHSSDPEWDRSGLARRQPVDPSVLLTRHKTLSGWLENEYTGNNRASYVPGRGLFWNTYGDELEEEISSATYRLLENHLSPDDEKAFWEIYEGVDTVDIWLREALISLVGRSLTMDVWEIYRVPVQAKIEEEQRLAREYQQQREIWWEQAKAFWNLYFQDITLDRIEVKEFDDLKLGERLAEIFLDTDPAIVEAIANVGLPKNFSNSIRYEIEKIAKNALED